MVDEPHNCGSGTCVICEIQAAVREYCENCTENEKCSACQEAEK